MLKIFKVRPKGVKCIKVELRGTISNRSGIGARVKCVSPSVTQIREVASATGYNSSDDPRAHFGLASDKTVTSIEVTWPKPNLSVQTLSNVGVKLISVCTEGSGCVEKKTTTRETGGFVLRPKAVKQRKHGSVNVSKQTIK